MKYSPSTGSGRAGILGAALLVLTVATGCGSNPSVPEIAGGLPTTVPEGQDAFDERIRGEFVVGSEVEPMVFELERQGFREVSVASEDYRVLTYRNSGFPVHSLWSVRWREHDGQITEIWGVFGHVGP